MTKKQVLRTIAFIVAVVMTVVLLCDLFEIENTNNFDQNMYTYRNLEEDTVDAVFLGTSGVDRYWIAPRAFEEKGLSVHTLALEALPAWLYTNTLDVALKNQTPELVILDMRAFTQVNNKVDVMDVRARRLLDSLPFFSSIRIESAFKTMKTINTVFPEQPKFEVSYLFSVVKYHSMWQDKYSLSENLGSKEQIYGGFFMKENLTVGRPKKETTVYKQDQKKELDPVSEAALYDLFEYIEKNNLKVLFVQTPKWMSKNEMGRFNTLCDILDEKGYDYLHYYKNNSSEFTITLDPKNDFYNEGHVNYYGAEVFTKDFMEYLDKNYNLPDRRGDEKYENYWAGKYDLIKETVAEYERIKAEKKKK